MPCLRFVLPGPSAGSSMAWSPALRPCHNPIPPRQHDVPPLKNRVMSYRDLAFAACVWSFVGGTVTTLGQAPAAAVKVASAKFASAEEALRQGWPCLSGPFGTFESLATDVPLID